MLEQLNMPVAAWTASLALNTLFALLCAWGLYAFYPRKTQRGNYGAAWLILAIWLGFLGLGLNSFYWRVFNDLNKYFLWFSVADVNYFGRVYVDFIFKGVGVVAVYLHFVARWKSIPDREQRHWTPLLMAFYPDQTSWAYRGLNHLRGRGGPQADDRHV